MMQMLEEDFKKLPAVVRGEITAELPPSIVIAPARKEEKPEKPEKPKQGKLF